MFYCVLSHLEAQVVGEEEEAGIKGTHIKRPHETTGLVNSIYLIAILCILYDSVSSLLPYILD